jgi:hypothetical protein
LFGNAEKDQAQISPNGKMLGYLAPEKGVMNVWVRTVGLTDDHVVTADKKRGIRFFSGSRIASTFSTGRTSRGMRTISIRPT